MILAVKKVKNSLSRAAAVEVDRGRSRHVGVGELIRREKGEKERRECEEETGEERANLHRQRRVGMRRETRDALLTAGRYRDGDRGRCDKNTELQKYTTAPQ